LTVDGNGVPRDIYGEPRFEGKLDIGADELNTSATPTDLFMRTTVNGSATEFVPFETVLPGDILSMGLVSPGGTYDSSQWLLGVELFTTGMEPSPPFPSLFPNLRLGLAAVLVYFSPSTPGPLVSARWAMIPRKREFATRLKLNSTLNRHDERDNGRSMFARQSAPVRDCSRIQSAPSELGRPQAGIGWSPVGHRSFTLVRTNESGVVAPRTCGASERGAWRVRFAHEIVPNRRVRLDSLGSSSLGPGCVTTVTSAPFVRQICSFDKSDRRQWRVAVREAY